MDDAQFWSLIARLDWDHEGDDDRVVLPVVQALAAMPRGEIAGFHDLLARKLHALDGREWARASGGMIWWEEPSSLSVDGFLYARCVVVANGRAFYDNVLANPAAMPKDVEFEALLDVARQADERQNGVSEGFDTSVSFETFANARGWGSLSGQLCGLRSRSAMPSRPRR